MLKGQKVVGNNSSRDGRSTSEIKEVESVQGRRVKVSSKCKIASHLKVSYDRLTYYYRKNMLGALLEKMIV